MNVNGYKTMIEKYPFDSYKEEDYKKGIKDYMSEKYPTPKFKKAKVCNSKKMRKCLDDIDLSIVSNYNSIKKKEDEHK
jgi:hypothetical protein